jgi:23S rRNA pseudouridine1911/1915/1917 synthase
MAPQTLTVSSDDASGSRLDRFLLGALPGWSRRLIRRLIAEGAVRVNGRRAAKGTHLAAGDRVTIPELPHGVQPEPDLDLPIVYADAALVVLDKPGGVPSHALDPRERGTAAAFVLARYPELADVGNPLAPGLVHRLDTGTSGLLVAARRATAHANLRAALRARRVEKRYLALVAGDAGSLDGRVADVPLGHDPSDRRRMVAAVAGTRAWAAETRLEVLGTTREYSVIAATIYTGVTHQVRVHLALAGHPILGDRLYGGPDVGLPAGRHALHATRLVLPHPDDGRLLSPTSPLPPDLAALSRWATAR